tara:strand:- start:2935 stop:4167 length:1233 start_codon:yes stop_codon:yes gene_type:complete
MKSLFIDCQNGISGDMLLSAFFDLGLPLELLDEKLKQLGLDKNLSINSSDCKNYGLRGKKLEVEVLGDFQLSRSWKKIRQFIKSSFIKDSIKKNILKIYEELAFAESNVHGCDSDEVSFHEISSLETLVNIVGVCLAFDYFKYKRIYSTAPPAGSGRIKVEHGFLPVPVPTVLEIAKRNEIVLSCDATLPKGELTTPSGIALLSFFVEIFENPFFLDISNIGIGLGHRDTGQPNLLRIIELNNLSSEPSTQSMPKTFLETLVSQEAWIDDSSSEDLAELIQQLRLVGALEVVSYPVQMKKGRQGTCVKAIADPDLAAKLKSVWFLKGTTIGLRETFLRRSVLARRNGTCKTPLGEIKIKQVKRSDGVITSKPEHDELIRLSNINNKSLDEIRNIIIGSIDNFVTDETWSF